MTNTADPKILIIEDSPTLALTYQAYLKPLSSHISLADTGQKGLDIMAREAPHLLILDLMLPDMNGLDILQKMQKSGATTKVIVITAHGSMATAIKAMRFGATDYLGKPFNAERLLTTAKNTLELQRLGEIVQSYKGDSDKGYGNFIGESPAMQAVYRMIKDAASSRASVFITGESGTGKEVCAETLHQASQRAANPFVALNCAAIPANLIESEIFGHKKGAFTGATEDREGAAQKANGGTLFLDELCEMPLELQAKMLRFIQTGQVVPVGSTTPIAVNVRFVCATNRSPWDEVQKGTFREDLYYRLHVIPIHLPPLRSRGDDILLLARTLLKRFAAEENKQFTDIDTEAQALLASYHWPGNVRELANVIQSATVLKDGKLLTPDMLSPLLGPPRDSGALNQPAHTPASGYTADAAFAPNGNTAGLSTQIEPLDVVERRYIERAVSLSGGNVAQAAASLNVHPTTLYRKMKNWTEK